MALLARLLYDLQSLDLGSDEAERTLASLKSHLGETEELRNSRETLARKEKEKKDLATRMKDRELDLEELREKIAATENTLYRGQGHSPKELASLQKEEEILKRRQGEVEDEILEVMDGMEALDQELEDLQPRLKALEARWQEEQARLRKEAEALRMGLEELRSKREALVASLDAEVVTTYEELRNYKGGVAVALVEGGICRGCGVDVPPSQQQEILRGRVVHCSNCERILYLRG